MPGGARPSRWERVQPLSQDCCIPTVPAATILPSGSLLQGSGMQSSHRIGVEEEGSGTTGMLCADSDDATAVPEETLREMGYDDVDISAPGRGVLL